MADGKNIDQIPTGYIRDLDQKKFRNKVYKALEDNVVIALKDRYTNEVQFLSEIFEVDTFSPHERFYLVVEGYDDNGSHFFYEDYISEWEDWEIYIPNSEERK